MIKKSISLILISFIFLFSFNIVVTADTTNKTANNKINWSYKNKTLTIYGKGKIKNYNSYRKTPWYDYSFNAKKIVIKKGITSIGRYAFSNFYSVKRVVISNTVTSISDDAFSRCYYLKKINLKNIKKIGSRAFYCCYDLKSINIKKAESIGSAAFLKCVSLKNVTFGKKIKVINESVFEYCTLKKVVIPSNVNKIKREAFQMESNVKIYIYNPDIILSKNFIGVLKKDMLMKYKYDWELCYILNYSLYSYKNSNAEKFAKRNNIKFHTIKP